MARVRGPPRGYLSISMLRVPARAYGMSSPTRVYMGSARWVRIMSTLVATREARVRLRARGGAVSTQSIRIVTFVGAGGGRREVAHGTRLFRLLRCVLCAVHLHLWVCVDRTFSFSVLTYYLLRLASYTHSSF